MAFPRVGHWIVGSVAGVALAAMIPDSLFPAARLAAACTVLFIVGLVGEVLWLRSFGFVLNRPRTRDPRPADGRVDVARIAGVDSRPNPFDARFRRFDGISTDGERSPDGVSLGRASPPLLGRVVIFSLFIGHEGSAWTDEELADAHEALLRSGAWVEHEAGRWQAAVNVEVAEMYFVADLDEPDEVAVGFQTEGDTVGPFEQDAALKAVAAATRAAVRIGFHDFADLAATMERRVDADAAIWLQHPRCAGRSFALPVEQRMLEGVALAVCYPLEASFPEPLPRNTSACIDPVTVVHELLHLFGASDKYGHSLREFEPGTVTRNEVMRLSESRLSRLRIDERTARELGWREMDARENEKTDAAPREPRRSYSSEIGGFRPE